MAYEAPAAFAIGNMKAGSDLRTSQYLFVKISAAGTVDVCTADTDRPLGVLQNKPRLGQPATVMVTGVTKVVSSTGVTAGAAIGIDAVGKAITRVIGTDTTKYMLGQAMETTTATGQILSACINCSAPGRSA